jgi:hypothetical protein
LKLEAESSTGKKKHDIQDGINGCFSYQQDKGLNAKNNDLSRIDLAPQWVAEPAAAGKIHRRRFRNARRPCMRNPEE